VDTDHACIQLYPGFHNLDYTQKQPYFLNKKAARYKTGLDFEFRLDVFTSGFLKKENGLMFLHRAFLAIHRQYAENFVGLP
jgi:hypothetical protein